MQFWTLRTALQAAAGTFSTVVGRRPLRSTLTAKTSYVDVTGDDAVIRLALPQTCSRKEVDRALLALFKAQAKTVLGDLMEAYRGSARHWARVVESLKREDEMGMLYDEEYDQALLEADLP